MYMSVAPTKGKTLEGLDHICYRAVECPAQHTQEPSKKLCRSRRGRGGEDGRAIQVRNSRKKAAIPHTERHRWAVAKENLSFLINTRETTSPVHNRDRERSSVIFHTWVGEGRAPQWPISIFSSPHPHTTITFCICRTCTKSF